MKTHKLKIREDFWREIILGRKTAEIRKDDRGYQVGDILLFTAIDAKKNEIKTNIELRRTISHIVQGGQFGIEHGYVMLSLSSGSV